MSDTSNSSNFCIDNSGQMNFAKSNKVRGDFIQYNYNSKLKRTINSVLYGIPLNPDQIVGREEDVDQLRRLMMSDDHKPVAITGLAASGKTSLAIRCACLWSKPKTGFVTDVALLDADTTASFEKSVDGFAVRLRLEVSKMNTVDIIRIICNFYNKKRKVLIIYDNLDDYKVINRYCFPVDLPNVYLLATTQLTEIQSMFQCYSLGNLTPGSSKELIRSLLYEYFTEISLGNMNSLLDMFQGHAFSIVQACAYILDTKKYGDEKNFNKIIEKFITHYERYMKAELPDDFPKNYNKVPFIALKLNIEKLGNTASKHVLCLLSYMDPSFISAHIIPKFENWLIKFNLINSADKGALRGLKKYSLVTEFETWYIKKLNVHRLVQAVCRMLVRDSDVNFEPQYIAIIMSSLQLPFYDNHHYYYYCEHVQLQSLEEACKLYIQQPQNIQTIHKYTSAIEDFNSWTILHVVSLIDHLVEALMRKFSEIKNIINSQTNTRLTPLHIAALRGNNRNVCYLLDNGCNTNLQDRHGNTAAHLGALFNHWSNALKPIYWCDRFNKMITNHYGQTAMKCIQLKVSNTFEHELSTGKVVPVKFIDTCCTYSIKSLTKEVIQEHILYLRRGVNYAELVQVTIDKLQTCEWWSDSEAEATRHVISLLGNILDSPYLECYILTENIPVSAVLDRLIEDNPHKELDIFITQNGTPKYKYYFKMVSLVIDKVIEIDPDAFIVLGYITHSRNRRITKNKLNQLLKQDRVKVEQYLQVLVKYDLIWEDCKNVCGLEIVSAMMHVYVSERGLTRDIVSVLLDNPHCTDEQINDYLKNTKLC